MLENTVCDTDFRFKINPISREISNATPDKNKLVQYDHNSERVTFEIPRIVDGFDISACNKVEVHYINIYAKDKTTTKRGVYAVEDFHTEEEYAVFSWLISGNATQYKGSLNFLIKFAVCGENGNVSYKWHTKIFTGIVIKEGMDNGEVIVEEYADVLEQWEARIIATEEIVKTGRIHVGSDEPKNGEAIWINPDENVSGYELIARKEIASGGEPTADFTDLNLSEFALYVSTVKGSADANGNVMVYKGGTKVWEPWISKIVSSAEARSMAVYGENKRGIALLELVPPAAATSTQSRYPNRCPKYIEGKMPFTRVLVIPSSGAVLPEGCVFELWGVKA